MSGYYFSNLSQDIAGLHWTLQTHALVVSQPNCGEGMQPAARKASCPPLPPPIFFSLHSVLYLTLADILRPVCTGHDCFIPIIYYSPITAILLSHLALKNLYSWQSIVKQPTAEHVQLLPTETFDFRLTLVLACSTVLNGARQITICYTTLTCRKCPNLSSQSALRPVSVWRPVQPDVRTSLCPVSVSLFTMHRGRVGWTAVGVQKELGVSSDELTVTDIVCASK
jgi:hypothetical protein